MCEYPGKPRHGKIAGTFPATYRAVAQFECLPGYSLQGDDAMHCQADGTWRGSKPTCERKYTPQQQCVLVSRMDGRILLRAGKVSQNLSGALTEIRVRQSAPKTMRTSAHRVHQRAVIHALKCIVVLYLDVNARKKERKKERKEGRKEGRKEERKKERKKESINQSINQSINHVNARKNE